MTKIDIRYTPGYVHAISPVSAEPMTVMSRWKLVQITGNDGRRSRHLVGRADFEGRVCTDIVLLDLPAMRVTTMSGRVYELEGPPGRDSDADWVFGRWLKMVGNPKHKVITRALMRLRRRQEEVLQ